MNSGNERGFERLAVIGAGNMGAGIAQKMATEGFDVTLVDLDDARVAQGVERIRRTLAEAVERKILRAEQVDAILARVRATADWGACAEVDLAVEAVFEDLEVKRRVFARLDELARPDAILATNTSSFLVSDLARATRRPERVLGLHYFYHPAKNRLVEVIPGRATDPAHVQSAWALQERLGKTPIRSADAPGFVVNRFFVPWLNEAVRLLEERVADLPTIEAGCRQAFGVGMGPFELMNVTGVPIALHAATTLGQAFGPFYAPAERLRRQVEANEPWPLAGEPDARRFDAVAERMLAVVFFVAAALVEEGVGTIEDTDIGARVGLRWPAGPFELMNRHGVAAAAALAGARAARHDLALPRLLREQGARGTPFTFRLVRSAVRDGVATLTLDRPDTLNALDEALVGQLAHAFRAAADDPAVRGIVITGAGKAFVAGADVRFFVRHMESGDLERIVEFTRAGHELLHAIASCPKPVVARLDGVALGGGLELALACRFIVASPRASVAFPETGIGIYPGLGGTQRTPRRIGPGLAKWLIYTGRMLGAQEACDIRLIDAVVPHGELDGTIRRLIDHGRPADGGATWPIALVPLERFFSKMPVEEIRLGRADTGGDEQLVRAMKQVATKAPIALRLAEKLIDLSTRVDLPSGLAAELEHLPEIFRTADAHEGLSTLGKRRPTFQGR
jgi:enoyl-CoA hydratase/3-hydroxyacyl-CoA dehydrogenase